MASQPLEIPIYGAGRIAVYKPAVNTYFYEVSDHLGNVRAVIGAPATETVSTNFETEADNEFQNYSHQYDELMDRTDAGTVYNYSQLLTSGYSSQIGLAKSLNVSPGDVVRFEAYAKHRNLDNNTDADLNTFVASLLGAFELTPGAPGDPGLAYNALEDYGTIIAGGHDHSEYQNVPKAYLNILLFDKNYNFVDAAYKQIIGAQQTGTSVNMPFDPLMCEITVEEPGYAYLFLSNENLKRVDVHFDDVTITQIHSTIVAGSDYYPFGLAMENREISDEPYRYGYQGQFSEKDDNKGWNEFDLRFYDAKIARWLSADPYRQYYSPYMAMGNRPHINVDPDGGFAGSGGGGLLWKWVANPTTVNNLAGYWTRTFLGNVLTAAPGIVTSLLTEVVQSDESKDFHFFLQSAEDDAIFMMIKKQSQYKVEISALMVQDAKGNNSIIVQPWNGNTEGTAPSAYKGTDYTNDGNYNRAKIKGKVYKILAMIHTHPPGGNYEGPSGPGNSYTGGDGDMGVYKKTGWTMFIIGPTEVSKLNPNYPPRRTQYFENGFEPRLGNRHKIFSTNELINGKKSLFNFLH